MRVFLVGFMGSGKSHNGKRLAKALNCEFVDLDDYLEKKVNLPITEMFELHGEDYFRLLERDCLREMAETENVVVATGGGAPCYFDNMNWMNKIGITVFIHPSINILVNRLLPGTSHRPLLKGKSELELRHYIFHKLEERLPYYTKAQHTVIVNKHSNKVTKAILKLLDVGG